MIKVEEYFLIWWKEGKEEAKYVFSNIREGTMWKKVVILCCFRARISLLRLGRIDRQNSDELRDYLKIFCYSPVNRLLLKGQDYWVTRRTQAEARETLSSLQCCGSSVSERPRTRKQKSFLLQGLSSAPYWQNFSANQKRKNISRAQIRFHREVKKSKFWAFRW